MTVLSLINASASPEVQMNEAIQAIDPLVVFSYDQSNSGGLNVHLRGGMWDGITVANQILTLTANSTNYVVANRTTGVASVSTATTNWNNTGTYVRLHRVTVGATTVTLNEDFRVSTYGVFVTAQVAIEDQIVNGVTDKAPSQNAVFDALVGKQDRSEEGVANGYAGLDASALLYHSNIPSSIDASKIANGTVSNTEFEALNGIVENAQIQFNRLESTGVDTGGEVTYNSTTTFNIAAGTGHITDHSTNPPTRTAVSWGAQTNVAATQLGTGVFTRIEVDSLGNITQTNSAQTDSDRLNKIQIGILIHEQGSITSAFSAPNPDYNLSGSLRDLAESIGTVVKDGLIYSPNGANLQINRSAGNSFVWGRSYGSNKNFPSNISNSASTGLSFYYNYRNGSGGFTPATASSINPNQYDNGSGTLQNVPSNKFTVQYIYFYPEHGTTFVMYGQNLYNSLAEATTAIGKEVISHPSRLFRAALRCVLVIKQGTTSLQDSTSALFLAGGKFGSVSTASSSFSSLTDLQSAYAASANPEIVLDNAKTNAGFTVRDSTTPVSGNLLEVQSNDGTATYLSASSSGVTASNLTVAGNLTVNGTTTTVNSNTVTVDDPIIILGGDTAPVADDNKDRGVEFRWHNGSVAKTGFFGMDDSTGKFTYIPDGTNTSEVYSGTLGTADFGAYHVNGTALAASHVGALSNSNSSTQNGYFGNIYLQDDSTPSHYLEVTAGSNLTAARTLTLLTGDANRSLTLSADATISGTNTGDQSSIIGITGTMTQFDTACTDGNFVFAPTWNAGRVMFHGASGVSDSANLTYASNLLTVNGSTLTQGNLVLTGLTTEECRVEVGFGRTGNGASYADFITDTTYTDYGLRLIRDSGGANTNSWLIHRGTGGLRMQTQDSGLFAVRIGSTDRVTVNAGSTLFSQSSSAANESFVNNNSTVSSSNTGQVSYYSVFANTAAASYTTNILAHYNSLQGTFGAGSTVTYQIGCYMQSNLTGATYNRAFQGNIPSSGTNNHNLYMGGTALNYLLGNTGVGIPPTTTEKLLVRGAGTTSATNTAIFENSSGTDILAIRDDRHVFSHGTMVFPKTQGAWVKVDTANPRSPWRDITCELNVRTAGGAAPTNAAFRGGRCMALFFNTNNEIEISVHIPHDYVMGTNIYLHPHWGHNGTAISGSLVIDYYHTYSKGHNGDIFSAEKQLTQTLSSLNLTNTPRYSHRVDDIQISTSGGSATLIDSSLLEPDGIIRITAVVSTIPTITGGSRNEPYIMNVDMHYMSTELGTVERTPSFWV